MIQEFKDYISQIDDLKKRERVNDLLERIHLDFPQLVPVIKWKQPMFMDHGTYIIGFSISKNHIAMSPEAKTIQVFSDKIKSSGYNYSTMIIRFPWNFDIDYHLIKNMIEYNINDKLECQKFWRE